MMETRTAPERGLYEKRWWALGVLILSLFVISLDNTVMNVALPTLVRELGASSSQLQWIVDAYTLVFAGLLLTMGSLGDRFGRKGALQLGLLIFGTGSVIGAFSQTAGQLIATRALMGVGGALLMPATLSILTNIFPAEERARAIAIWAGIASLGFGIGPAVGGLMLDRFWWGSVLLVNAPVVVLALVLGRALIPTSKDPSAPKVDLVGAGLSVAGLSALLYGIIEGPRNGWADAVTVGWLAAGLAILGVFVAWELRREQPMLNVRFFRNPRFTAASTSVTLVFFAIAGTMFFLTQYLQFMLGYTPLQAGLRIIPIALAAAAGAPVGATMAKRLGTRVAVFAGLLVTASAFVVMATVNETSGYGIVLLAGVIGGFGNGIAVTPATDSIMGSLPREKAGVGSAVNDTTREVGGALGVAILGSLLSSVFSSGMADAVRGLPAQAAEIARDGIGGALAVAQQVGGTPGRAIVDAAKTAFVDSAGVTMLVAAVVAVLGSLVALVWLPARERAETQEVIRVEVEPVEVRGAVTERVA